jgi:molybdopterin-synthase adenylyltransferase
MTSTTHPLTDRDVRQRELVPPERLAQCRALVVGVGAIGRQVAVQLAALGIGSMDLVDHDQVNIENLAPQSYWPQDLGHPKVQATGRLCRQINPDLHVREWAERFRRSSLRQIESLGRTDQELQEWIVFACVDSMVARSILWESTCTRAAMFVDARMNAEVVRVLAAGEPPVDRFYSSTLFDQSEAYHGSCTARSTVYAASIAAGLMLSQFAHWLRGLPVERDLLLNLLSAELTVQ